MNTKLKKSLNIAAGAIFVVGLAINVQMTLDDPFGNVSAVAWAQQTGTGDSGDEGGTGGGTGSSDQKKYKLYVFNCLITVDYYDQDGNVIGTKEVPGTYGICAAGDDWCASFDCTT